MSGSKISQREARRLRKELNALLARERARMNAYNKEFPDGIHLINLTLSEKHYAACRTAVRLGFPLLAKTENGELHVYAVKP